MKDSYTIKMTEKRMVAAVLGGLFLGGGGGGALRNGLETAQEALVLGDVFLVSPDCVDKESMIVTVSAVGSPASKDGFFTAEQCLRGYEVFDSLISEKIGGFISNENGGGSTTNGWLLAAMTGLPVIDAPCNGRAHPTGPMGSMGLSKDNSYKSVQVALGGNPRKGHEIEVISKGSLASTSHIIRRAAVEAGGVVTVLRNPVTVKYLIENAAVGAIKQAMAIGEIFMTHDKDVTGLIESLNTLLPVNVLAKGTVERYDIQIKEGFDVGGVAIESDGAVYELTFWNEYMTVECSDERLATFPDLIVTLDAMTGAVLTSAEIKKGDEVLVVCVSRAYLKLGQGMYDKILFKSVEAVLGKDIVNFVF